MDSEVEFVPVLAIFGLVGLLFVPYLNFIVLFAVLLAVAAAVLVLAGLLLASPYLLGRSLLRYRHARTAAGDSAYQGRQIRSSDRSTEALAGPPPRPVGGSHHA